MTLNSVYTKNRTPFSRLFDAAGNTRFIEAAYTKMYERYQADLPPDHIYIAEVLPSLQ
jgi:hypothetical protein